LASGQLVELLFFFEKKNGFKNKKQARATARNMMRNTFRTTVTYFETT